MSPTTAPSRRRCRTSGGEISYVDAGSGRPVVLLHGFPASSYTWRREVPLFGSRMRVIAPDLLGYGESEKPAGANLSVSAQAGLVGELLAELGIEGAAVVGHGIGGAVAQRLSATGPAGTLVLVDAVAPDVEPDDLVRSLRSAHPDELTAKMAESLVRRALQAGVERHGALTEADIEAYVAPWRAAPGALVDAARAIAGPSAGDATWDLGARDLPLFVVWGEEDAVVPVRVAERFADEVPGATVAILPGCGHFVTEDAPTTVGPLIFEFLRRWYLKEGHVGHPSSAPVPVYVERPPPDDD